MSEVIQKIQFAMKDPVVSMCITLKKRLPFPSKKNVSFVPYNLRYLLSLSDRTVGVFLFSSFIFLELRHFCILVRVNWYLPWSYTTRYSV